MAKQYGTVKVDYITFTSGTTGNETDVTLSVSGLSAISDSGMTITGDITARNVTATGTLSGATITGDILKATSITGVTGVFTTLLSGASITGELISGTSGIYTYLSGTSGVFTNVTGTTINSVTGSFTTGTFSNLGVTGTITGDTVDFGIGAFATSTSTTGYFPDTSGTSAVGSADFPFASGVFTTVTGTNVNGVNGAFTELTVTNTITGNITGSSATATTATNCSRSVVAGSGLTGGGQLNADRTLNAGAGDGISVAADSIAVDSTVVRTTGNQTIGGTKTFSSDTEFSANILPDTDDTGNVGTNARTWNNGRFTNLQIDSTLSVRGAVDLADNDILRFGSADDVELFFNGANFFLDLNSGGNNFIIRDGTTTRFTFDDAGDLTATRTLVAVNFKETVYTITWSSGFALNPLNGETQFVVLGGNSTPTQSNWDNGESITLHIDDGSSRTITWTTLGVVWTGGSAPTLATTGDTVVQLWKAGGVIYGALVGEVA